jgi:hypothetical protein
MPSGLPNVTKPHFLLSQKKLYVKSRPLLKNFIFALYSDQPTNCREKKMLITSDSIRSFCAGLEMASTQMHSCRYIIALHLVLLFIRVIQVAMALIPRLSTQCDLCQSLDKCQNLTFVIYTNSLNYNGKGDLGSQACMEEPAVISLKF